MIVLLLGMGCAAGANAWTSQVCASAGIFERICAPFFEPVHEEAIAKVLGPRVGQNGFSDADLRAIMEFQRVIDADRGARRSFRHALTGDDAMRKPEFRRMAQECIRGWILLAAAEKTSPVPQVRQDGLQKLARAIHTMEDATSPAHRGFQVWRDAGTLKEMSGHWQQENAYPSDPELLEDAVRDAWDFYQRPQDMPTRFFDETGRLLSRQELQNGSPGQTAPAPCPR